MLLKETGYLEENLLFHQGGTREFLINNQEREGGESSSTCDSIGAG